MKNKNNLVDFIGIGVQKSATTWLYSMLISHPEIKGAKGGLKNKEVNFFNRSYFLGFDWYSNKFEFGDRIVGEFSTLYFPECSVVRRANRKKISDEVIKPMTTETRHNLNTIFKDDIVDFESRISRDLSQLK